MRLPNMFNRLSLNLKLNALVIAVFVILVLVLSLLTSSIVRGLILNYGQLQLREEADLLQAHFDDQEENIINAGRFLAFAPGLVDAVEAGDINQ
ncbi:MAG: hypothetical protein H7175_09580, partial [Burkholderiales bacterium]|nr:hypothetical protein [Anaerolineae bacterium]